MKKKPLPFLKKLSPRWLNYLAILDYGTTFDIYRKNVTAETLEKYLLCVMMELCHYNPTATDLCNPQGLANPQIDLIKSNCYRAVQSNHTLWDQLRKYQPSNENDEDNPIFDDVDDALNQESLEGTGGMLIMKTSRSPQRKKSLAQPL